MEPLDQAERLMAHHFDDAPRELKATIDIALRSLRLRQHGDALNMLRQAQEMVDGDAELSAWRAELAAMWALYHSPGGPDPNSKKMWRYVSLAQRLEPENERLQRVVAYIEQSDKRRGKKKLKRLKREE
jgi:hypothetical protein